MRFHHLINDRHTRQECPYCHNNLDRHKWYSLFELQSHYKQTTCDKCSRNIMIKVLFHGSGHDCWDKNSEFCGFIGKSSSPIPVKPLEEKINEKKA